MASISWTAGIGPNPVKVITMQGTGVYGQCDYTLDAGQTWTQALLVVSVPGHAYDRQMGKDSPKAGKCEASVLGLPPAKYDVTAKLYYRFADGTNGIVNSTTVQVTV